MAPTTQTLLSMSASRAVPVGELADGTMLRVRPLGDRDRAALAERFRRLSPDTRYARFLHPLEQLSPGDLDLLVDSVDGETHVALVLEAVRVATDARGAVTGIDVTGVGVGRYVLEPERPRAADVAFTVDDDWHGLGCGRALAAALADHARARGVRVFTADVLADNTPCLRLLAGLGRLTPLGTDCGVSHLEVELAEPDRRSA